MLFRYSRLCGTASDAIDAVKLEIPKGFKLLEFKMSEYLKNIVKVTLSKIRNAQLRSNLLSHFNKGLFKYQAISPESFIKKNLN